jgi:penicillin-binding protein 2
MIISAPFRRYNPRLRAIGTIIASSLFALLVALWRVQVVHGGDYGNKQENQSLRRIRIPAARGEIVDRNGVILANNRPSYDVAIYLDQLGHVSKRTNIVRVAQASLGAMSAALGMPLTITDSNVLSHYETRAPLPLPVWRDLRPEQVAAFAERASNLPGADLIVMPVRQYPQGSLAAQLLGYVGRANENDEDEIEKFYYYQPDRVGQQGVERACDEYLRGSPGGRTIRVNPSGMAAKDLGEKEAEQGGRVTLTIDVRLQRIAERELAAAPPSPGKELTGVVVLLDVRTGEVLAMASLPSFDPNIFNPGTPAQTIDAVFNDPGHPMLNRATGARYPPGSIFKPITLLAGLASGAISPQDTVTCSGSLVIGNWRSHPFHCWYHGGHGRLDAYTAIKESCDVWFYEEGMKTGVDAITRMAAEFGLGQPTGFDIGSETRGLVPTPAWKRQQQGVQWWEGDTAQLSIGQSYLLVTPLQMACVAATFANRGTSLHPHVVKQIETADGQVVHEGQPDVRAHLGATPQQIEVVRHAMLGAVQDADGTAHTAAVKGLSLAGKTGTAQYKVAGKELPADRAWFIGFAPYDQPQVAICVLIEAARDGSHTAAAVASAVFAQVFGKRGEGSAPVERGVYED